MKISMHISVWAMSYEDKIQESFESKPDVDLASSDFDPTFSAHMFVNILVIDEKVLLMIIDS